MTHTTTNSGRNGSTLDRTRATLRERQATAAARRAKVAGLDDALAANAVALRTSEAGLRAALDRVAELKKALKSANKQREKLRVARKDAGEKDVKATRRAESAEAKYDRAVLADMLGREKDHDLAVHGQAELEQRAGSADDSRGPGTRGKRGIRGSATRSSRTVTTPRTKPAGQ